MGPLEEKLMRRQMQELRQPNRVRLYKEYVARQRAIERRKRTCPECGRTFRSPAHHKVYCTNACMQRKKKREYKRRRRARERELSHANAAVG